jgi:hypothetical protein
VTTLRISSLAAIVDDAEVTCKTGGGLHRPPLATPIVGFLQNRLAEIVESASSGYLPGYTRMFADEDLRGAQVFYPPINNNNMEIAHVS